MYTASDAFFDALWEAGVTHCFVNLGSDHPSIIETMVKGAREKPDRFPRIITCPNEMVAMSMADGFARRTGRAQCVIVHVDVGTQGLGAAVHNASTGRAPVLVFAGLSPFTLEGELRGSRTEYIHWIQDVPDQKQIVAQYCRYASELRTGANIRQMVGRALQLALSQPQGPAYLCAAREVLEEEVVGLAREVRLRPDRWGPARLGGLPGDQDVAQIARALAGAREPLAIVGYMGRNQEALASLVALADAVPGLRVVDSGGSDLCFPADHPGWLGMWFGSHAAVKTADVVLVLDCDVPWIPTQCKPAEDARVFHVDADPLKQMMPIFYFETEARYRADAKVAVEQITAFLERDDDCRAKLARAEVAERKARVEAAARGRMQEVAARAQAQASGAFGSTYLGTRLRKLCPEDTIWVIEAVTGTVSISEGLQPTLPGSWLNCGGGGLGWSGGAAMGVKLATMEGGGQGKFVVQIVGDGTFLFSVPGSVYWIARRYRIPVLTIVLNNNGWNAPRRSLQLVHPDGEGAKASNEDINISFNPVHPDYGGIAKAAAGGELFAARVDTADELDGVLKRAVAAVLEGQSAVVDCKVELGC